MQRVDGAYGIVVLNKKEPDVMIAARKGSPLVLGIKDKEFFIGSDISPIIKHTQQIIYLEDTQMAIIEGDDYKITSIDEDVSLPKKVEKIDFKTSSFDESLGKTGLTAIKSSGSSKEKSLRNINPNQTTSLILFYQGSQAVHRA